jgi:hypothetical protein
LDERGFAWRPVDAADGKDAAWIHARMWTGKAGNGKIEAPNVRCKRTILAAVADPAQRAPVRSFQ